MAQGPALTRFRRAIERKNLLGADRPPPPVELIAELRKAVGTDGGEAMRYKS